MWGDTMSALGDVQYIRGYHNACGDTMSTSGDVQYIRGYHDACEGYHEYIGGCSVLLEDIMLHVGDTMSTSGDVQYNGGYHEYIRGYHEDIMLSTLGFSIEIERFLPACSSTYIMTSPDVLMISLRCTHGIPHVLNIP